MKLFAAVLFLAAMTGIAHILIWKGFDFCLGVVFGMAIFELGYRAKTGTWYWLNQ